MLAGAAGRMAPSLLAWQWNLNKSLSLSGVEQTLFNDQELDQLRSKSNRSPKIELSAVLKPRKSAKSGMTEIHV